jgi:DDE family transposase
MAKDPNRESLRWLQLVEQVDDRRETAPRCPRGLLDTYASEPIDTAEQLLTIVDQYRSRWVIEEFFKALETGCSFEKRQLESYRALSVALAVFLPIAWRLLLARSPSRVHPDAPATTIAPELQLTLLRHDLQLPSAPTTAKAACAIANSAGISNATVTLDEGRL